MTSVGLLTFKDHPEGVEANRKLNNNTSNNRINPLDQ